MDNKKIPACRLYAFLALVLLFASPAFCQYSGGDGSEVNPYRISDANDWRELMTNTNDWSYTKNFILTADVNLAGIAITPVGNSNTPSFGRFDGNNHVIRNVTINRPNDQYVGLFGYVRGEIKNLGLEDVNIIGCNYVGGLAGYSSAGISNCHTSGCVNAASNEISYAGGLIGFSQIISIKDINNCYSTCSVFCSAAYVYAGGLIGMDNSFSKCIWNCYATGDVYSPSERVRLGGLIGDDEQNKIKACYATGSVSAPFSLNGSGIGGLIGGSAGQVSNCYARGPVFGNAGYIGGLIGSAVAFPGDVMISNCYSTGLVTASTNSVGGLSCIGSDSVADSFWDKETSGQTKGGGTCLTTTEMKMLSTFTQANWDFINTWAIGENQTYPYLRQTTASDINQDNKIDYFDLAALAENWLSGVE